MFKEDGTVNSPENPLSIEMIRWTFTVSPAHRVEIETYLLDLGLEIQARGDDVLVVTWDEPEGGIHELIEEALDDQRRAIRDHPRRISPGQPAGLSPRRDRRGRQRSGLKSARAIESIRQIGLAGLANGSRCGEERRNRFAGVQPDRTVQAVADLGGRIDSEALVDGRGKIGRSVGAAGGIGADLVGTADSLASLNASPGKGGREDGCPAAQDLTIW